MFPIYIDLCVELKYHEISIVHFRMFIHFMLLKCIFIGSHVRRFHGCSFYLLYSHKLKVAMELSFMCSFLLGTCGHLEKNNLWNIFIVLHCY